MRRFQRNRRNLMSRPRRQPRQIYVPQAIWYAATNKGALKFSEHVVCTKDEDFTVDLDLGGQAVVRIVKGTVQSPDVAFGNLELIPISGATITDGSRIRSETTRGGIRGPEGLTLAGFNCRIEGKP